MVAASGKEAVQNGRDLTRYDQGMCQKYVRDPCWRVASLYGSAIEAWNGSHDKHPGDRSPPLGAPCYYRGGQYGHAVIYVQEGPRIRSTDCTTATYVNDAALSWPETAWGYEYLGWTGDLNGVDLPLGTTPDPPEEEDMPLSEDDLQRIAARVNKALGDYDNEGHADPSNDNPDTLEQRVRQIENVVRNIQATVNKLAGK